METSSPHTANTVAMPTSVYVGSNRPGRVLCSSPRLMMEGSPLNWCEPRGRGPSGSSTDGDCEVLQTWTSRFP
ncbi:unnamed protein product [Arctogadus glacialis]